MKTRNSAKFQLLSKESVQERWPTCEDQSDSSGEPGLFSGLVAWFSTSVSPARIQSWLDGEGTIATSDTAMFLFSEDPEAEDTVRLYKSEAYLNEYIAIFHVDAVSAFIKKGGVKKVALGKYFLPPKEVHEVIKSQFSFKWETNAQLARRPLTPSPRKKRALQDSTVPTSETRVQVDGVQNVTPASSKEPHQTVPGDQSSQHTATQPAASESRQEGTGGNPTIVFKAAYVDISQLQKVEGDIEDFTFGKTGYQVVPK